MTKKDINEFLSVITKNLNWEILTFKRWNEVKDEKL